MVLELIRTSEPAKPAPGRKMKHFFGKVSKCSTECSTPFGVVLAGSGFVSESDILDA